MKIFLGDLHIGLRNDQEWYHEHLYNLLVKAVKHAKSKGINDIVQSGDFFDVRKATTQTTMNFVRNRVEPLLRENEMHMWVLVGNHDLQFKNKIQPNAPREILAKYDVFTIVDSPTTIGDGDSKIDLIPWICEENSADIFKFIAKSTSKYCMGHFELAGFYFYKNSRADHGLEADFLKKYDKVWSGHYHHANEGDNVFYIGTPLTMTANDEDENRGFYEWNGTSELKFIQADHTLHKKIIYPLQKDVDLDLYKDVAVRLFINQSDDDLSKFQTKLESIAFSVDQKNNISNDSEVADDFEITTTLSVMHEFVKNMNHSDEDKAEIMKYVNSLYNEAMAE
ncbi:recombination endonuclease [Pectobacterium phage POP12]|nr:recombination endonuclease [Pectobacterium phage POP12]